MTADSLRQCPLVFALLATTLAPLAASAQSRGIERRHAEETRIAEKTPAQEAAARTQTALANRVLDREGIELHEYAQLLIRLPASEARILLNFMQELITPGEQRDLTLIVARRQLIASYIHLRSSTDVKPEFSFVQLEAELAKQPIEWMAERTAAYKLSVDNAQTQRVVAHERIARADFTALRVQLDESELEALHEFMVELDPATDAQQYKFAKEHRTRLMSVYLRLRARGMYISMSFAQMLEALDQRDDEWQDKMATSLEALLAKP